MLRLGRHVRAVSQIRGEPHRQHSRHLAIRGIDADLGEHNADTFFNDLHKDKRFDSILANPLLQPEGVGR